MPQPGYQAVQTPEGGTGLQTKKECSNTQRIGGKPISIYFLFLFSILSHSVYGSSQAPQTLRERSLTLQLEELWSRKAGANPCCFFLCALSCSCTKYATEHDKQSSNFLAREYYGKYLRDNGHSEAWGTDVIQLFIISWAHPRAVYV